MGARFDAVIGVYGAIPFLFSLLWNRVTTLARCVSVFAALIISMIVVADFLYFPSSAKRLGYEAWVYLNLELIPIALTAIRASPVFSLCAISVLFALSYAFYSFIRMPVADWKKNNILSFFLLVAVSVFLARGGAQRVPIRLGDAIVSTSPLVNNAVLNAPYSVLASALLPRAPRVMDADHAQKIALETLALSGEKANPALPLLRTFPQRTPKKLNVVLILFESFTGSLTEASSGVSKVTPEFDKLARDGMVFPKFIASGFRTTSGLFSALSGLPDSLGVPLMRRPELNNSFASLSRLLKEQGYKNYFVHGGLLDFDNLDRMVQLENFDRIEGKDQLQYTGGFHKTWGYADEHAYKHALKLVSQTQENFFLYMLTVSSHAPYEIPPEKKLLYPNPEAVTDGQFLNAVHYADQALGEFIAEFRSLPQFKETIFIITGDHTHHGSGLDPWTNQHVPFLIYAPGLVAPGKSDAPGSHTDIVPTGADLLGLPWVASWGRSLLSDPSRKSYFINGLQLGLWDGQLLSFSSLDEKLPAAYQVKNNKAQPIKLDKSRASELKKETLSLYQFSSDLIQTDRVAPKRDSKAPFKSVSFLCR